MSTETHPRDPATRREGTAEGRRTRRARPDLARRSARSDVVEFAEQVLGPLVPVFRSEDDAATLKKLSSALWKSTFGRVREVLFWTSFCGGMVVAAVVVGVAVNLGAPISVPLTCLILLFSGQLSASLAARSRRLSRRYTTPELDELLRARARLEDDLRLPEQEAGRRAALGRYLEAVRQTLPMRGGDGGSPRALRPEDGPS